MEAGLTPEEAEKAYFIERGWVFVHGDIWRNQAPNKTRQMIRQSHALWSAHVYTGDDRSGLVCTGPDPITCFITAELMNWSKPDV